jgi:hypothetical protein
VASTWAVASVGQDLLLRNRPFCGGFEVKEEKQRNLTMMLRKLVYFPLNWQL